MSVETIHSVPNHDPRSKRSGPRARIHLRWALFALLVPCLVVAATAQDRNRPTAARDPLLFEQIQPGGTQPTPALPAAPFQCPRRESTAGNPDHFVLGNVETAVPSADLKSVLSGATLVDFDNGDSNKGFAHTFQLPPCGCIVAAKLEFRAKAHADIPENDSLNLGFSNQLGFPRWVAYFGTGNTPTIPTLTQSPWTASTPPADIVLDLANLPPGGGPTSLLSAMQTHRYLDFYVQDDTSIDYIRLTYTICDCPPCGKVQLCVAKFNDKNRNRLKETNEPWLAGWSFQAKDQTGQTITFPPTNADGRSCITVPAPATYTISEVPKLGWSQTTPQNPANPVVNVTPGVPVPTLLFGNWRKVIPVDTGADPKDPH